jgi:hypothetical protein
MSTVFSILTKRYTFYCEGFMKNIRHLLIYAIALCSLWTPSFCVGEKLLGARILNKLTIGAPNDVAKNPKQSAAYLDTLNEKVEELRTEYQSFMSTDELTATIRGNQTKTKQHIERKKKWNETTAVYGLRNARLTTERPELIDAVKLIAEGEKQEKKLRTRSKKLGFKPGLKKAEDKIKEFKERLEKANIADTTTSATTGLTAQQIQDKATLLRKELEEAFKYNRTVAIDILGFNLAAKTEGADTLYFSPLSSKDKAWIKKIQEQATSFFNKVKSNAEDKKKLLDENEIRDMYKKLWDTQEPGTKINFQDPAAVYARLTSTDGPLQMGLPKNISDIITTYNEIDFETRLSTAVVDSMAGQCPLLKKNQPAPSTSGDTEATASSVPLIISSGWLNNVQTYIAGYQDLAVLAGLGIYSARKAVQDIQKQVEAAIEKLNSYLQIIAAAQSAADSLGAAESDTSGSDSATEKAASAASTKAAREATVEKVHTAFSNLTADNKKSVKELCQTIETTLRTLHNQYQRLLNGNRIIALKAELILPTFDEEGNIVRSKQKYANQTTRDTETITSARTEFKEAKTKLYDLLAMIQAVRSGSFTPEDKKAIVERPKTLANLFFIMDQKDADEEAEVKDTNELDTYTAALADTTIERNELEKQSGARAIRDTEQDIRQRELKQQQTIRGQKLVATKQQLDDITALVKETQDVIDQAASAGAPAEATQPLERIEWSDNPLGGSTAETLRQTEQAVTALANASEALTKATAKPNVTPAKRKMLEGLRNKFTRLGEQWSAWRGRNEQPKAVESADWALNGAAKKRDSDQSSATRPSSRPARPQRESGNEPVGLEMTTLSSSTTHRPSLLRKDRPGDGAAEGTSHEEDEESATKSLATPLMQHLPAEVKKQISWLQRLLRRLKRHKTADALDTSGPQRTQQIITDIVENPDADNDGEVDDTEQESAEAAKGILARISAWLKSVRRRTPKSVDEGEVSQGAATGTGYDSFGAAQGSTRESESVDLTDDPSIRIVRDPTRPKTEEGEGIYRLTNPLTILLNQTTKNLATFRIMDGGNSEITNITNIWLTESDASLTVYTQIPSGYSKTVVAKADINEDGELVITVRTRNLGPYEAINDKNLVYPTIGSYWQNTASVKPIADHIKKPTAERRTSDAEGTVSLPFSSSSEQPEIFGTGADGMFIEPRH